MVQGNNNSKFHYFSQSIADIDLPEKFTYPFHYTPHPLCVAAAEEVQAYLNMQGQWQSELKKGKMFGVLIVQNKAEEIGYLAAFSGILAGRNLHEYFVPPIYDLQQPQGFFRIEEEHISAINARIQVLENDASYLCTRQELTETMTQSEQILTLAKARLSAAKTAREEQRQNNPDATAKVTMIQESQHQKAEFKRLKQSLQQRTDTLQAKLKLCEEEIEELQRERKNRSAALQQKLFGQFSLLNARNEISNLCDIFEQTIRKTPPAGAGECAAPKMLQYAYLNHLHPIAIAEFWWGESPKTEIRRQGYYYPACPGKCGPILGFMLQGLQVEDNPLLNGLPGDTPLEILFEDEWLLAVNKPAGLLSVPGKSGHPSVYQLVRARYPGATGPMIVHRLDMATSGVLLIAKTKEIHKRLQAQFRKRMVKKCYIAVLDGISGSDKGTIDLPLCADPNDRPRQMVDDKAGKPTLTEYEVLSHNANRTRIAFYPHTGRTHQLRVHAAHVLGLNTPIIGDELYGKKADRLYLHAERIEFRHPVSGETICIEKKTEF